MNGVMKHLDQSVPIYEGQDDAYRQTTIAPPLLAVPKGWRDTSGTENLRTSLDLTSDGSEVEPGQPPITSDYLADDLVDQAVNQTPSANAVENGAASLRVMDCPTTPDASDGQTTVDEIDRVEGAAIEAGFSEPERVEVADEGSDGHGELPPTARGEVEPGSCRAEKKQHVSEQLQVKAEGGAVTPGMQTRGSAGELLPLAPDDWPDIQAFDRPVDLGCPALPSACLPERVERLIMTIACALGVPLTYVVMSLLVCVAALVGCWRRIRVSFAWVEPSTLAAVLVGPPGLLKSHIIDTMLHELRAIQAAEHAAYLAYCGALRAKRDVVWAQEQIYRRAVAQAVETGKPLPYPPDVRLADLQIPRPPALVSTSGTPQGLRDLAARSRTGLLSAPDELPRFLKDHDSPSARAFLMTAYDGRHDATDLVTRGRISADHFSISLLATIQPAMLPQIIGPDDGLLARLAWVPAGRGDAMPRSGKRVPTESLLSMFQKIRDLVPQSWGANVASTEVMLEPKAAEVLRETRAFYDAKARDHEGLLASGYAKAGGLAARLASAIDLATFGLSSRAHPGRISLQSVEAAATLVEAVLMPGAEAVFGLAAGRIEDRDARDLLAILRRRGWNEVNQRDLQRACSGRLSRTDVLDKAIRELAERGIVRVHRVMPGPAGGAPRKTIQVNPRVFT